jgi:hypothetical protein
MQMVELIDTYRVINKITTNMPNDNNPNHGDIANNTPPDVATPLPPDLAFAKARLNLVLNNLKRYSSGQQ